MPSRPVKNQNALNRWLNRYFSAVIAAFFLIFLFVAYFVVILPKAQLTEEAIRANVLAQKNLYEKSKKKLANLQALAEVYSQVKPADLEKFNAVLPGYYPPEKIFGELEEIISRGGWRIIDIKLASDQDVDENGLPILTETLGEDSDKAVVVTGSKSKNVGQINMAFSVSAIDYAGFKQLLRTLENNLRLFDVVSVQFLPGQDLATFKVKTYYYKNVE